MIVALIVVSVRIIRCLEIVPCPLVVLSDFESPQGGKYTLQLLQIFIGACRSRSVLDDAVCVGHVVDHLILEVAYHQFGGQENVQITVSHPYRGYCATSSGTRYWTFSVTTGRP